MARSSDFKSCGSDNRRAFGDGAPLQQVINIPFADPVSPTGNSSWAANRAAYFGIDWARKAKFIRSGDESAEATAARASPNGLTVPL